MMELREIILEGLGTLTLNKTRTGLAILGIVIGIGSVITLLSLGQATQKSIQDQIQSLGANLLTVQPGAIRQGGVMGAMGGRTTLTLDDAKAILSSSEVTTIKTVSPEVEKRMQVTTGKSNSNVEIVGVTPQYAEVHKIEISSGSFITQRDVDSMTRVAVLGPTTVTNLFGEGANPVSQTIRINGKTFTIVGVTVAKGGSGFMSQDDRIYVPLYTAQKQLFGISYLNSIAIEANSPEVMMEAQNQVGYLLLARHNLSDPTKADFSIMSQQDILDTASSTTKTFTTLLSGIAAISLLVGGIGIMNIMLVSVTERTREIGLRKAVGATYKEILQQFLVESILLTLLGGLIGVLIGVSVSLFAGWVVSSFFLETWATTIPPNAIVMAFVVSSIVGLVFGIYPARSAARLNPIDALRYE